MTKLADFGADNKLESLELDNCMNYAIDETVEKLADVLQSAKHL